MKFTAKQIAKILDGEIEGNPEAEVSKLSKIEEGEKGSLSFLSNPKYNSYLYTTKASIVIVNHTFKLDKEVYTTLIRVKDAYTSFSKLLEFYNQVKNNKEGKEDPHYISKTAKIGINGYIAQTTARLPHSNAQQLVKILKILLCSCAIYRGWPGKLIEPTSTMFALSRFPGVPPTLFMAQAGGLTAVSIKGIQGCTDTPNKLLEELFFYGSALMARARFHQIAAKPWVSHTYASDCNKSGEKESCWFHAMKPFSGSKTAAQISKRKARQMQKQLAAAWNE